MFEIIDDPYPGKYEMARLWQRAWGSEDGPDWSNILVRSLAHVGVRDGAVLIGFVNVAWDGGAHAFVLDTTVDPDYRRRGIGVMLVKRAAALAKARGAAWLHVDFEPHLEPFYAACGFGPTAAGLMRLID